jgi:hypothetical protein
MRAIPRQQIRTAVASVGIGLMVFGLIAYSLILFSFTQNIAQTRQPDAIVAR